MGKRILTYGTYDFLHIGHINILKRAKSLGDYLLVGLSTDEFNMAKKKSSHSSFSERKEILESIKYVDEVFAEKSWDQKIRDVQKYNIDIFIMGDDWSGEFDFLMEFCQVLYLPRTKGVSTSIIKNNL